MSRIFMSRFASQSRKSSHLCMKEYILKILIYLIKDDCSDEISAMHFTSHNTTDFAEMTKVDIKTGKNPYAVKNKKKRILKLERMHWKQEKHIFTRKKH